MMTQQNSDTDGTLSITRLSKSYGQGRNSVDALKGLSLSASAGETLGLLGPNGSGKTTLIKCVLGLVKPDAGSVRLFGSEMPRNRSQTLARVGAVLEGARNIYWRLTVRENIHYFAGLRGLSPGMVASQEASLLSRLDLADRADHLVGTLSRGYQQRAAIASALISQPQVLFLDEPTLGLDVESRQSVHELVAGLAASGTLTIVTSHDMEFVESVSTRILVMREGRFVAEGTSAQLRSRLPHHRLRLQFESIPDATVLDVLSSHASGELEIDERTATVYLALTDAEALVQVMRTLPNDRPKLLDARSEDQRFADVFLALLNKGDSV